LLVHFVEEEWVRRLDFARTTIIDKSFIADQYKETEADLIYRVPLLDSEQMVYIYLLIEFQSTVDRFMVVRVGHYLHSFYLDYRDSNARVGLLPLIFPIVLYNGSDRWSAPTVLRELVEPAVDFGDYGVAVSYFPIIINQIPLAKLMAEENIVSTLFLAEAHYDVNLLVERLLTLYAADEHKAVSLLANWYRQMRVHKRVPPEDYGLLEQQYRSQEEIHSMIVEAILKQEEQIRGEGKAEGKAKQQRLTAQRMSAKGYPLPVIAELLGLNEDEVRILLTSTDQTR
jgi:hypothetical protein